MVDFSLAALAPQASPNPLPLQQKLLRGSPVEIANLASSFANAAGDADYARVLSTRATSLAKGGYVVDNQGVEPGEARQTQQLLGNSKTAMRAIAATLNGISNDLQTGVINANKAIVAVRGELPAIARAYNAAVARLRAVPGISQAEFDIERARLERQFQQQAVRRIGDAGTAVRAAVTTYETRLAGAQRTLSTLGYAPPSGLNTANSNPLNVPVPPAGTNPKTVAAWWLGLDKATQDHLIGHQYRTIGNLNGVSAVARDQANRIALEEGSHSSDPRVRANAISIQDALDKRTAQFEKQGVPVQLLAYERDAFPHDAKFAIAIGNVDTANNVSVLVPGLNTTNASASSLSGHAAAIYNATHNLDPTQSTATIAWFGYDPPNNERSPAGNYDVQKEDISRAAGGALARDVAGIRATNAAVSGQDPHITAIGHSYGSNVVSRAAHDHHLQANDLVLVGSVGAGDGINSVEDYPDQYDGHVYSGAETDDGIRHNGRVLNGHGGDPNSPDFGARVFDAESENTGADAHSNYFDSNSHNTLRNIGSIASGHGVAIPVRDPDAFRPVNPLPTGPDIPRIRPR
ncbi:alpha/beta hydrolase family protein [Herbihabitans rhizosphaerae]|uniref:Alpha/beta hydrolase family protein n=1 Tax=Herbihabitans rhizosphaerae TaxID=1872711 RepID=A0A4Q7KC80_9PSEU|nr:alpha/beta hydrolase [Herbihabitans rhizosphaerae]RZS30607.1 alpha/beta hydrolase family protein [Herbihabitans rhizosphaerae]